MALQHVVPWARSHGAVRLAMGLAMRKGEVQASLVMDPAVRRDPFPVYDVMRSRAAIYRGRLTFAATTHAAVSELLRSDAFRVGLTDATLPPFMRRAIGGQEGREIIGPIDPPSLLAVNPPDHTRYRKLVSKVFTPRAVAALEPRVAAVADQLLDELQYEDTVDLVDTFASLLPVIVIAEILGVPTDRRDDFLAWGNAAAPSLDIGLTLKEYVGVEKGVEAFNRWIRQHIRDLRANPGEDMFSRLVMLEDDGGLTETELVATGGLLLAAGFETTVNLLGNGTLLLLRNPDQLARLREDPSLWANAVDEMLRIESPVQNTARYAGRETTLAGKPIKQGQFVSALIGSANNDPAVFENPRKFDVGRANARDHLAFSAGVHYCIGAALARAEARIGLQRLFDRYPDLSLAGEPTRRRTRTLRGLETLPVHPGAPARSVPEPV